ncbi:MAG: GUN4 domain-containing protein [Polyangiaceae bacterium]|nr:GUN4 domain-containing protein [Polyangiaceae bacterium]
MIAEAISAAIGFVKDAASRIASHFIDRALARRSRETEQRTTEIIIVDNRMQAAAVEYTRGRTTRDLALREIRATLARNQEIAAFDEYHSLLGQSPDGVDLIDLSKRAIELREQALDVVRQKLEHARHVTEMQRQQFERFFELKGKEVEILRHELDQRNKLGLLHLDLLREREAKQIQLKLDEIQGHWDRENWSGILSRTEMQQILATGQKRHRLLMLVSPPDISEDCPDAFVRNLQMDVRGALKQFLEEHYPATDDSCSVEFYGKFFKASVFDVEVKQLESLLAPVPTAVIYSDITDELVRLHIRLWGIERPFSITIPWDWERVKDTLVADRKISERDALRAIRQLIVKIHQWTAAFLADMYFLTINPHHSPRMYHVSDELPEELVGSSIQILRQVQADVSERYESQLRQLALDTEASAERMRRREEEDRALGPYKELRDLLESGRWLDADNLTRVLILKETERTAAGFLDQASVEKLSQTALETIDNLWRKYSAERFGFSAQQRVFAECDRDMHTFLIHAGWAQPISQNDYRPTLRFSLSAPEAHLPVGIWNLRKGTAFRDNHMAITQLFLDKLESRLPRVELRSSAQPEIAADGAVRRS